MRRLEACAVAGLLAAAVVLIPAGPAQAGAWVNVYVNGSQLTVIGTVYDEFVIVRPVVTGTTVTEYSVTADFSLGASSGCIASATEVTCPATGITTLYVWLGPGNDGLFDHTNLTRTVYGNDGADAIYIDRALGQSYLDGGPGDDVLVAGIQSAALAGGPGNDILHGGDEPDYLSGDDGDDFLNGSDSADVMVGGNGFDVVSYNTAIAPVTASLDGVVGNDGVAGEGDTIASDVEGLQGGQADDYLVGNPGPNRLEGSSGADTLVGGDGDDTLGGGGGDDWLDGGPGNDTILGENGGDFLLGGAGNDRLEGGSGYDSLQGGTGIDGCLPGDGEPTTACEYSF
jgi:Ca2+-binding RTX toxin-like protein